MRELAHGYDAEFWYESYTLLREAVIKHLNGCIREDDVAEEAILVDAIEMAGKRLAANEPVCLNCGHIAEAHATGGCGMSMPPAIEDGTGRRLAVTCDCRGLRLSPEAREAR